VQVPVGYVQVGPVTVPGVLVQVVNGVGFIAGQPDMSPLAELKSAATVPESVAASTCDE
jgi:hypothetical protein